MRTQRRPSPRLLDEFRAYHEAGHAVAAVMKGFTVKRVSIRQCGRRGGACEYVAQVRFRVPRGARVRQIPDAALRRLARATAAVALGGSVAQDAVTLERGYIGCDDRTSRPLPLFAPGADDDERVAMVIARALYRRASEQREFLRRMRSTTERLLASRGPWRAVRAVATELLRVRTLDARRAERIVREALRADRSDEQRLATRAVEC
jgi:hypothetical protein